MGKETSTPVQQLEKLDNILDEYERSVGLPQFSSGDNNIAQSYLSMNKSQIEKLSLQDCASGAYLLGSFAFHIQRAHNREMARVNWADNLLKSTIAGRESNYRGSWESQFLQAAKEDKYTNKLLQIKNYAEQRAARLTYLSNSIRNLSDLLVNVQKAKLTNG